MTMKLLRYASLGPALILLFAMVILDALAEFLTGDMIFGRRAIERLDEYCNRIAEEIFDG